ncbi:MAG: RbsD/FucU domain-containing protein [Bacteroidales bacterium]|nr:RbsD/FucU domain-containing protein [Bacteroidales bacterium]
MNFALRILLLTGLLSGLLLSCKNPGQPPEQSDTTWTQVLEEDLNLLGHRNWILVVDKAFPEQSSPGMKYLYVEQDLLPTLEHVLQEIDESTHVKAIIYQDQELAFITEEQVAGIADFRTSAAKLLDERPVNTLLHEEAFKMLDESSSLFRVLVVKTNCTLPYTSVFLQLDCSYWGPENEKTLRENMEMQPFPFSN